MIFPRVVFFLAPSTPSPLSCLRTPFPPSNSPSVKVEQTLRDVQISRSRLRFLLLWLEQVAPVVTDSNAPDGVEEDERHPPCLTLANSILTILREPLPSDQPSSSSRPTATISRVRRFFSKGLTAQVVKLCAKSIELHPRLICQNPLRRYASTRKGGVHDRNQRPRAFC